MKVPAVQRMKNIKSCVGEWTKFKAVIHYVCDSFSETPASLGKVKLQKILWNSDRAAFLKFGKAISGATYVKMPEGPATPSLGEALAELEREKKLKIRTTSNGPFTQYMYLSLEEASDSLLTKQEIRIIDSWIRYAAPKTAKQLSKESHDLTWEMYEMGDEIDLSSTLLPALQSIDPGVLEKSLRRFNEAAASEES